MVEGWFWGVAMLAKLPGFDSWLRPNFYFAILKLTNSRDLTFSKYISVRWPDSLILFLAEKLKTFLTEGSNHFY